MATIQNPNGSSSSSSSTGRRKPGSPDHETIHDIPDDSKKMWLILGGIVVALIVAVVVAIAVTQ